MGDILRFPNHEGSSAHRLAPCPAPEFLTFQRFDPNLTSELHQLATGVVDKAKALVRFIDSDRALARAAGVETIAIELSAIFEGMGIQQVVDALEDSASQGKSSEITFSGLERLRRAEKLLAEASSSIDLFAKIKDVGRVPSSLGQAASQEISGSSDTLLWVPIVVLGVIGVVSIIAVVSRKSDENR